MYSTIDDFCQRYGARRLGELIQLLNDPDENQDSIAAKYNVRGSCVSRWKTKFCDVHIVLKAEVVDFLESYYARQWGTYIIEKGVVDEQRKALRLIKGASSKDQNVVA